jgi:hypothetical protein
MARPCTRAAAALEGDVGLAETLTLATAGERLAAAEVDVGLAAVGDATTTAGTTGAGRVGSVGAGRAGSVGAGFGGAVAVGGLVGSGTVGDGVGGAFWVAVGAGGLGVAVKGAAVATAGPPTSTTDRRSATLIQTRIDAWVAAQPATELRVELLWEPVGRRSSSATSCGGDDWATSGLSGG